MHGLIIRSFEGFLRNTYGAALWEVILAELDAGIERFEPMFHYDDALAARLVEIAETRLAKPCGALLEDFGTYLVAHPASERVRRLLRFGGVDYEEFLLSLEDLAGRARLAVPDLDLPGVELTELGSGEYHVGFTREQPGAPQVFLGLLRALADDYGALVMVDYTGPPGAPVHLSLRLLKADFASGRGFRLAAQGAGAVPEAPA
jgi:Haem-NO-binding